jgi:hypothetical protein
MGGLPTPGMVLHPTEYRCLTLSQAIKAYAPDVAVSPLGDFVVIWHEEHWPAIKTTVQPIRRDKRH